MAGVPGVPGRLHQAFDDYNRRTQKRREAIKREAEGKQQRGKQEAGQEKIDCAGVRNGLVEIFENRIDQIFAGKIIVNVMGEQPRQESTSPNLNTDELSEQKVPQYSE